MKRRASIALIILVVVAVSGCKDYERDYPKSGGVVYEALDIDCINGVMYVGYSERTLMRDINENLMACTTVRMTRQEFEDQQ